MRYFSSLYVTKGRIPRWATNHLSGFLRDCFYNLSSILWVYVMRTWVAFVKKNINSLGEVTNRISWSFTDSVRVRWVFHVALIVACNFRTVNRSVRLFFKTWQRSFFEWPDSPFDPIHPSDTLLLRRRDVGHWVAAVLATSCCFILLDLLAPSRVLKTSYSLSFKLNRTFLNRSATQYRQEKHGFFLLLLGKRCFINFFKYFFVEWVFSAGVLKQVSDRSNIAYKEIAEWVYVCACWPRLIRIFAVKKL